MELNILYEDTHIIVCEKPAGIPTQTKSGSAMDMVSLLKNYIFQNAKEKRVPYLGLIHRLDQPVSGLLVFGKTPFATESLNQQMRTLGFGKHYKACVQGRVEVMNGSLIDFLVKDNKGNVSRVCKETERGSKKAILHYEKIKVETNKTLLNIQLETGRHHQIRVQLANAGYPIIGDTKYNKQVAGGWEPLQLFAWKLEFLHPKTKKKMVFVLDKYENIP